MKAAEWIDRVKQARGWTSDYRVAKELGLSKNTIGNYRSGSRDTLGDDVAVKLATALEVEPVVVLLDQAAERTQSTEAREAITKALKRLTAAGLAAMAFLGGPGSPPPAVAAQASSDCYVKSRRKRRGAIASMADALRALTASFGPLSPALA